jgi:outer membrane protein OmpA-like peptidoglycan-associated protein
VIIAFADYLMANENLRIEIQGHTDNVGAAASNLALSTDRAFTIYTLLTESGIKKERLAFKGLGASKPVASNESAEGRAQNRRTEFVILSK